MFKILLSFLISFNLHAACSSISRSNASGSSILTSTKYNADLNTVYGFVNSYDGGCIQSGTLEAASLNSSEFAAITKGAKNGCGLSFVNTNTVQVEKCQIAVNGKLLTTATPSTLTWGCSGCSSEATGTFYVYVKDSSTFTLAISSTAPGKDGYNGTDRAVGSFYNNSSLDILSTYIYDWSGTGFTPTPIQVPYAGSVIIASAEIAANGTVSLEDIDFLNSDCSWNAGNGRTTCTFNTGFWATQPKCFVNVYNSSGDNRTATTLSISTTSWVYRVADAASAQQNEKTMIYCIGQRN